MNSNLNPAINIQQVGLRYGSQGSAQSVQALDNVTFSVPAQKFVSILGLSGCGKSSLLKLTTGLLKPTAGRITVSGMNVEEAREQRAFGFVFQAPVLLPWRSVLDNAALLLEATGISKDERYQRARRYLKLVGLGDFERYRPRQLSG